MSISVAEDTSCKERLVDPIRCSPSPGRWYWRLVSLLVKLDTPSIPSGASHICVLNLYSTLDPQEQKLYQAETREHEVRRCRRLSSAFRVLVEANTLEWKLAMSASPHIAGVLSLFSLNIHLPVCTHVVRCLISTDAGPRHVQRGHACIVYAPAGIQDRQ